MIKLIVFLAILQPLIKANYRLRELGWARDEWFWADRIALSWGYSVEYREARKLSAR